MNEDTLTIVCSFLTPLELSRVIRLSRWYYVCVEKYLHRTVGTTCLEEFACPYCGDWISRQNILLWDGFFNVFNDLETTNINRFIREKVFPGKNPVRHNFLCEDCEYEEREEEDLMSYAGNRTYTIVSCSSFTSLIYVICDNYVLWNEIRLIN